MSYKEIDLEDKEVGKCSECGRLTWTPDALGKSCNMIQPNGTCCVGVFKEDMIMLGPRIIKRYQNRKLYDTKESCYTTLDEIAEMIQRDVAVKVIDNRNQNDITSQILLQLIYEKQKRFYPMMSAEYLHGVVKCEDWFFQE